MFEDTKLIYIVSKRSSNTYHAKNRVEYRCSGRSISFCSTSDTRRV